MEEELLPCPFCGKRPEVVCQPDPDKGDFWTIRCCYIDDFDSWQRPKEKLIQNWNNRAFKQK